MRLCWTPTFAQSTYVPREGPGISALVCICVEAISRSGFISLTHDKAILVYLLLILIRVAFISPRGVTTELP
jgi:hypothetical protein